MQTAAVLQILITANSKQATAAMAATNKQLVATEGRAGKATKALSAVGKVGALGLAAGVTFAVKKAADFEAQLDSLGAVTDASGKQMDRMRKQALKAGADTKYSALEAAKAQTELAKGGLSVAQISKGALKSALALAAAGELDLAEAAETTANALNLFGLRGKDSMKVANALAKAANDTTADVSDFAMALKQGGAVAKSAGLSFSQTVLALEALAKSGVRNSDAGTSLKTALIQLIKPTDKQAELADKLGLNFISASGNMKNMADISAMLRAKLGDMTKAQRTAALATLAGTDGVRTLTALYDAGPAKLDKWEAGLNESGTAAEVAKKKQDNLKGALENLQGSVETIAIKLGSTLLPALTDATKGATDFLNALSGGDGPGASAITGELDKLRVATGLSSEDMRKAGEAVSNVWGALRAVAARVFPAIRQIVEGQMAIIGGIVKVFAGVLTLDFRRAWSGVKSIFSGGLKAIAGQLRAFSAPFRELAAQVGSALAGPFKAAFRGMAKLFGDVMAGILRRFASFFELASHIPGVGSKFKGLAEKARDAAAKVDGLGEAVKRVPKNKTVNIRMKFSVPGVGKDLELPGFGGSGMAVDQGIQKASQQFVKSHRDVFSDALPTLSLGSASGSLGMAEGLAHRFGLATTSGFRRGDKGWHGKNRARDFSNGVDTPQELAFARMMVSKFGSRLLELIHTPLGYGIKNGKRVPLSFWGDRVNAMHHNHVHVAMQRGGMLPGSGNGDRIPVMAEPGEGFINKRAVKALGGGRAINAINAMVPRFAKGGIVTAADAARKAGFKGALLRTMLAISGRETGGTWNPRAQNLNAKTRDHSIGLWQINQLAHKGRFGTDAQLKNPYRNARAAFRLYKEAGLRPWAGRGDYAKYYDDADRAIAALRKGGKVPAKGRGKRGAGGILGSTGLSVEQLFANRKKVTGRRIHEPVRKGSAPFSGNRPPRVITALSEEQLSAMGGDTSGPSGPSPAEVLADQMRELAEQVAGLKAETAERNRITSSTVAIGLREAERALADMISRQLGGITAHRAQTPGTGRIANY